VIVGDVMSTEIITIGVDAPLKEAATMMVKSGVSGLPVVDDDRKVIGIITEADFVTAEANRSWGRQRRRLLANFLGDVTPPSATSVADVMSVDPHTIDSGSSVTEAARMMTDLRVKRLPVVFPDGTLCGIISRADVMGVFARPDDALAEATASRISQGRCLRGPKQGFSRSWQFAWRVSLRWNPRLHGLTTTRSRVRPRGYSRDFLQLQQNLSYVDATMRNIGNSHTAVVVIRSRSEEGWHIAYVERSDVGARYRLEGGCGVQRCRE